jgi:hypothetical protein
MWMIEIGDECLYLFGNSWMTKDKEQPELTPKGKVFAAWIRNGSKITSEDVAKRLDDYKNILSDDPKYLKKRIEKMCGEIAVMKEVMEINEMAREELAQQQNYRNTMHAGIQRLCNKFRESCQQGMEAMHAPKTPSEQFAHGRGTGKYETFAQCAQYLQDVAENSMLQSMGNFTQKPKKEESNESAE